jgi:hypothetical protein
MKYGGFYLTSEKNNAERNNAVNNGKAYENIKLLLQIQWVLKAQIDIPNTKIIVNNKRYRGVNEMMAMMIWNE